MRKFTIHLRIHEQRPADAIGDWQGENHNITVMNDVEAPNGISLELATQTGEAALDFITKTIRLAARNADDSIRLQ